MAIHALPDGVLRPVFIGHEPTWSASVELLIGGGEMRLPTGAAAGLEVLVERWPSVGLGTCRLRFLLPPRMFGDVTPA
jgi:phosphohistidine phosphatase